MLLRLTLLSALLTTSLANPHHPPPSPPTAYSSSSSPSTDTSALQSWPHLSSLLDSIDNTVLHGVLHQLSPQFKDGVFSKDRSAIEHVHSRDPAVASKLVHIALKRQAGNSTASSVSSASASEAASISSALSSAILASTVPAATTVLVAPDAPAEATAVATVDGGVVFSTIGGGLVTLSSSEVGVSFTRSTSSNVFVTTLPNGEVQTRTSVVVVNAPVTDAAGESGTAGAAATTGSPGLQDAAVGLSALTVGGLAALFAGVGGLAFML